MLFFWMIVIVGSLLVYVILDGYDLGIGVLTLFQRDAARRRRMIEVVGNVWDGNESWLILIVSSSSTDRVLSLVVGGAVAMSPVRRVNSACSQDLPSAGTIGAVDRCRGLGHRRVAGCVVGGSVGSGIHVCDQAMTASSTGPASRPIWVR